jgi:hypothetical protein
LRVRAQAILGHEQEAVPELKIQNPSKNTLGTAAGFHGEEKVFVQKLRGFYS